MAERTSNAEGVRNQSFKDVRVKKGNLYFQFHTMISFSFYVYICINSKCDIVVVCRT